MIQQFIRLLDLLDIQHLDLGIQYRIKVPIHIFKDILYSILLGVPNRPNRRETQPFCQRRLDNEQGRTAGARDEIHAIGMEFWYRLRKHAMIIHIHQPDTVRADQGGSRLIHDIQHLLLQNTALVCLLAEAGRDHDKSFYPLLPGQHFHHLGARFTRNRDDRQLRLRDIMYRRIRLDALHVCLLGVYHT